MSGKNQDFFATAKRRKREQEDIVESVTAQADKDGQQDKRTTMNISLSLQDKIRLKQYAAAQNKTTAAVIQEWIREYCTNN